MDSRKESQARKKFSARLRENRKLPAAEKLRRNHHGEWVDVISPWPASADDYVDVKLESSGACDVRSQAAETFLVRVSMYGCP